MGEESEKLRLILFILSIVIIQTGPILQRRLQVMVHRAKGKEILVI